MGNAQPEPEFTLQCTRKVLEHFPLCINAMLLQAEALGIAYESGGDAETYRELEELCGRMIDLGYIPMPQEVYEEWLHNDE